MPFAVIGASISVFLIGQLVLTIAQQEDMSENSTSILLTDFAKPIVCLRKKNFL